MKIVAAHDFLGVIGPLQVHGEAAEMGKVVTNARCGHGKRQWAEVGRLTANFSCTGTTHKIALKVDAQPRERPSRNAGLPHAIDGLITKRCVQWGRTARESYGSRSQKAVVAEAYEGREPVAPTPRDRGGVGTSVVAEVCADDGAAADRGDSLLDVLATDAAIAVCLALHGAPLDEIRRALKRDVRGYVAGRIGAALDLIP